MLAALTIDQLAQVTGGGVVDTASRIVSTMGHDAQIGGAIGGVVGTVGGAVAGGIAGNVPGALAGAWTGAKAGITAGEVIGGAWGLGRGIVHEMTRP